MARVGSLSRRWAFGQARDRREEGKGERMEKEREKRRAEGKERRERERRKKVKLNYEFCQEIQYCYHSVLATRSHIPQLQTGKDHSGRFCLLPGSFQESPSPNSCPT